MLDRKLIRILVISTVFLLILALVGYVLFEEFDFSEEALFDFFSDYAYSSHIVFTVVIMFMLGGSFGLPIPEEVVLISSGLVAHVAMHPEIYPPPYPGAIPINVYELAAVCFFSVIGSDMLVFVLGKFFGKKVMALDVFKKHVRPEAFTKINQWTGRYGFWACGIFRFTPGLRFPGFLSCGMLGVPFYKFLLVDGSAALLSVPTQVLLVAFIGETVLGRIAIFKKVLFWGLLIAAVVFGLYKLIQYLKAKRPN